MSLPDEVELFGGPGDGKVVPLLGIDYRIMVEYRPGEFERVAVYQWEFHQPDKSFRGVFQGVRKRRLHRSR